MTDRLDHLLTKEFTNRTEAQNLNAICEYLSAKGYFWWRQNNTGVQRTKNGKQFWTRSKWQRNGVPDVFVMQTGTLIGNGEAKLVYRTIGIEAKSRDGRQSPEQKAFQRDFEENGGVYILARGIDDLVKFGI